MLKARYRLLGEVSYPKTTDRPNASIIFPLICSTFVLLRVSSLQASGNTQNFSYATVMGKRTRQWDA